MDILLSRREYSPSFTFVFHAGPQQIAWCHPHWRGWISLLCLLDWMLISSRNTLPDTPRHYALPVVWTSLTTVKLTRKINHHSCNNKIPQTDDENNRHLFLTVLEAISLRSRCQQVWFLLRPLSLACRWPPTRCVLTWPFLCLHMTVVSLCMSNFLFL